MGGSTDESDSWEQVETNNPATELLGVTLPEGEEPSATSADAPVGSAPSDAIDNNQETPAETLADGEVVTQTTCSDIAAAFREDFLWIWAQICAFALQVYAFIKGLPARISATSRARACATMAVSTMKHRWKRLTEGFANMILVPLFAAFKIVRNACVSAAAQLRTKRRLRVALVLVTVVVASAVVAKSTFRGSSGSSVTSLAKSVELPLETQVSPTLASLRMALNNATEARTKHLLAARDIYQAARLAEQEGLDFAVERHRAILQAPAEGNVQLESTQLRQLQEAYDAEKRKPNKDFALLAKLQAEMSVQVRREAVQAAQAYRGAEAAVEAHRQGAKRRLYELEARLSAEVEAHDDKIESLTSQVALQEALEAAVARKEAALKEAENAEAWVQCAQLQQELDAMPKTVEEHYDKVRRRNAEQIAISQSQAQARAQAQAQREAQMKAEAQAQREAQMKAQAQAQREAQMKAQAQAQREAQMKAQAQAQREAQMKAQAQARAKDHLDVQQGEEQAKDIDKGQSGAKLGAHQSQVCDHAYREFESGSNTRTRFDQKVLQEVPEVNTHNDTHQELDDQIVELLQDFLDGTLELRGNDGTQFIDEFFGAGTQGKEQTKQAAKERTTLPKEGHAEDDEPRIKVPSEATVFTVPVVANWSDELWTDIEAALVAEVLEELPPRPRGEREEWAANTGWGLKEDTRPFDRRHYKRRHSQDRHNEQQRRRHRNQEDFMKHATRKSQM